MHFAAQVMITIVKFYLTLNITIELIKPKLLLSSLGLINYIVYTKVIPKMSLQNCPPSVANTMLGICYTCNVLYCNAHGYCAIECGVACCAAQHTATVTLTAMTLAEPFI